MVGFGFLRFEPLLDYPFMAKAHQQRGCPAVASIADADVLFVSAGDPAGEDDPIRKGTAFQVCATLVL